MQRQFRTTRRWAVGATAIVGATIVLASRGQASVAPSTPSLPTASTAPAGGPAACASRGEISAWPLRDQAANLVMVGLPVTQLREATTLVRNDGLGGILVRGTPKQSDGPALRVLRDAGRYGRTFVAVDEEGGRVQHLKSAVGALPSARSAAKTLSPAQLRAKAATHGRGMAALGFTMNLAPDVDVDPLPAAITAPNNTPSAAPSVATAPAMTPDARIRQAAIGRNGIGDRSFSANPLTVADYGQAFAQGMLDAGIVPVLKHFPGHGSASGDSHNVGASTPSLTGLRATDLTPFAKILADPRIGVMTAHLYVPGLDDHPASISERAVTQLLRGELGHRGLVVTDSLSMWPIRFYYPPAEAAVLALRAGNDVLLFDDRPSVPAILDGLVAAMTKDPKLAAIAIDANIRVLAAKGRAVCEGATVTPTTVVVDRSATAGAATPTTLIPTTQPGPAGIGAAPADARNTRI